MALVRHELGFATTRKRFPAQGHLPRDLLARRQQRGAARRRCSRRPFRGARGWEARAEGAVRRLRRGEAGAERPRLRRPAAVLGRAAGRARPRRGGRRALRPRAGRRVPGHQPAAGVDPARAEAGRAAASPSSATTRSRSTRSARPTVRNILDFPQAVRAAGARGHAGAQLPLDRSRSSTRPTR